MKNIRFFALFFCLFIISVNAEAQFLNRLKNKVIERTEDVIINKAADKAAESTSKAMDKLLNQNLDGIFNIGSGKMVDVSELPAEYSFDHLYRLKMTTDEGELEMDYLFNKNENYFGAKSHLSPDMLMIFDSDKNLFIIKTGETVIAREIEVSDDAKLEGEQNLNDYTFKEIPSKVFHGISCPGYEMENDENKFTVYIAPDVGVGFGNSDGGKFVKMPKEMHEFGKRYENGLMMYMEMKDKQNSNRKVNGFSTMECIAFEETSSTVKIK